MVGNNEAEATTTATTPRSPTRVGFVKAFVTQSNWSGPVCQETWHGHHAPWCRVLMFLWLSSLASSWATLYSMTASSLGENIPLLKPRGLDEDAFLDRLRTSHSACLQALCDQVGKVPLHCVVQQGQTARVEWQDEEEDDEDSASGGTGRNYEVHPHNQHVRTIPVPEACHVATEVTLGARLLQGQPLLTVKLRNETSSKAKADHLQAMESLFTVLPTCELLINAEAIFPPAWAAHFYSEEVPERTQGESVHDDVDNDKDDDNHQHNHRRPPSARTQMAIALPLLIMDDEDGLYLPGHVEHNILQQWLCPAHMAEPVKQEVLPILQEAYGIFLQYRHNVISFAVMLYYDLLQMLRFLSSLLVMLITTMVVRYVLPWPSSIRFAHVWQMLVLLSVLAMEPLLPIHPNDDEFVALLVPGTLALVAAVIYRDMQAAMEWAWLATLGWGAHSVISPWLDVVNIYDHQAFLDKIDGLHILRRGTNLGSVVVVGDGWWKLVTLYVWIRAYGPIYKQMQRQTQQRLDAQDRILRAYYHNMQQQQQEQLSAQRQPPVVLAHDKPINQALRETQINMEKDEANLTEDDPRRHLKAE